MLSSVSTKTDVPYDADAIFYKALYMLPLGYLRTIYCSHTIVNNQ